MNDPLSPDMVEATRLTQAGRLGEATALLQKLLRRGPSPGSEPAAVFARLPLADAWAESDAATSPGAVSDASATIGPALHLPKALRDITGRLNLKGTAHVLRGLLKHPAPVPADAVPAVGAFVTRSFSNPAGSRSYKLYIPSRYDGTARPLIVMLHGCSQSPDDFAAGTRMNFVAEEQTCFVVYPEQAAAANAQKCWNWFNSSDQKRGQGEPSLVAGITREVMADYVIDASRVYIAGLSAGGAAAAVLGEAYPDLYAAVGVHSGLACGAAADMFSAFAAMRGDGAPREPLRPSNSSGPRGRTSPNLRTIVFHGDRDSTVHPRNGAEVIARANTRDDLQTTVEQGRVDAGHTYTRSIQRDASGRGVLEQWVVHGAGHAWSGGSPAGSFTDPHGPDATKEMLRFFLGHGPAAAGV